MDEIELKDDQRQARRELLARDEFIAAYCVGWPAIYKQDCPFTDSGAELLAWKAETEGRMQADLAALIAEQNSPWQKTGPRTTYVNWSDVDGRTRFTLGLQYEPSHGMPAPVKHGSGIDPYDRQHKPYHQFAEVSRAELAAQAGVAMKSSIAGERERTLGETENVG